MYLLFKRFYYCICIFSPDYICCRETIPIIVKIADSWLLSTPGLLEVKHFTFHGNLTLCRKCYQHFPVLESLTNILQYSCKIYTCTLLFLWQGGLIAKKHHLYHRILVHLLQVILSNILLLLFWLEITRVLITFNSRSSLLQTPQQNKIVDSSNDNSVENSKIVRKTIYQQVRIVLAI